MIPPTAHLLGTIRSVSERAREMARDGVRRVAEGVAAAHGVEAKVHVIPGYPVTVNDAGVRGLRARRRERSWSVTTRVVDMRAPIMGAEDFSYVLQRVPGAMRLPRRAPAGRCR